MCAPCKVVINEANENSARLCTLLAQMIIHPPPKMKPGSSADDALYEMAAAEVEHVMETRRQVREFVLGQDVPERWQKLIVRLYGED